MQFNAVFLIKLVFFSLRKTFTSNWLLVVYAIYLRTKIRSALPWQMR